MSQRIGSAPGPHPVPTPRHDANDLVAVIDFFGHGGNHGEDVWQVLAKHVKVPADRIGAVDAFAPLGAGSSASWPSNRVANAAEQVNGVSRALEAIAVDPNSSVRVVNMSLDLTKIAMLTSELEFMKEDPALRQKRLRQLGLGAGASEKEVTAAVAKAFDRAFDGSVELAGAKARYDAATRALMDRGVAVVVSAGNRGDDLRTYEAYTTGMSFGESVFFNEDVIVVGASTGKGHELALFTTPSREVDLVMDGVDVDTGSGLADGTSYAAPQVSAVIADMVQANPALDVAGIKSILWRASTDTLWPAEYDGHGILDRDAAVALAQR